ncbi:MAG: tetratricopeptide repeat protein [Chlamydiales bacterium]
MRSIFLFIWVFFLPLSMSAALRQVDRKWSQKMPIPIVSIQEHYDRGCQAFYEKNWDKALLNFTIITTHFPESPFYVDSIFYLGASYYFKENFDLANQQFDLYLIQNGTLTHFEKVFDFKYEIVNQYEKGRKKHLFGLSQLPKWSSGKRDIILILDEIIAALPGKEIAAKALYMKGETFFNKREYRESINCFQILIRRFLRHSLAADSYVKISDIYYQQSLYESQNPDLISLAKVNINKFGKAFPGDERIHIAEANLIGMEEIYAQSLYNTGRFYEKKKKPCASVIYYENAIQKYPMTHGAQKSKTRLTHISSLAKV